MSVSVLVEKVSGGIMNIKRTGEGPVGSFPASGGENRCRLALGTKIELNSKVLLIRSLRGE